MSVRIGPRSFTHYPKDTTDVRREEILGDMEDILRKHGQNWLDLVEYKD